MEVSFLSRAGIADDAIFSVRAGPVKRQAPASANKAFRFPRAAKAEQQDNLLKFDLLTRVGTGYIVLKPFDTKYKVAFSDDANCEVDVKWSKSDEVGPVTSNNAIEAEESPAKPGAARDAQDYLDKHGVLNFVQAMIQAVVKERPADPYAYMGKQFLNGYDTVQNAWPPAPLKPTAPAAPKPGTAAEAGNSKAQAPAEDEQLRSKIRDTLERSCSNGSLGRVVTEVKAEVEGAQPAREELQSSCRSILFAACDSGALEEALKESVGARKREMQAVAVKALEAGQSSGKLEEALIAVKKEKEAQDEAIRLRVRSALERGQRDGSLEGWLKAEVASSSRPRPAPGEKPGGAPGKPAQTDAEFEAAKAEAAKKIQSLSRGKEARKLVAEKKQQQ